MFGYFRELLYICVCVHARARVCRVCVCVRVRVRVPFKLFQAFHLVIFLARFSSFRPRFLLLSL